jgi:hexosaminidase
MILFCYRIYIATILLCITCKPAVAQHPLLPYLIPTPVQVQALPGTGFALKATTALQCDARFLPQAQYLAQQLEAQTGLLLAVQQQQVATPAIQIKYATQPNAEQYQLHIDESNVLLTAQSVRGVVNAIQTLLQLLPVTPSHAPILPACSINDYPKFAYRGMHLDVVRHFFDTAYIKKYIEYLAFHKYNTFHWHLTDDQGWRIEMLSYPRLHEISSWRKQTLIGHFKDTPARYDGTRYGGYYTRQQIKDIVAFAAVRGIDVVPEIDIPGHSRAILAAYPELGTRPDTTFDVATTWGMYNRQNNVLAPKPATFQFLKTVFQEVADLFPSSYFHLGGDECSKLWWKQDTATQRFMKAMQLPNEKALQAYFIEQVAGYLKEKNKMAIGWHEILESKIDTQTIVMNWGDNKPALEAVAKNHRVIMTPGKPLYFDHYPSETQKDSLAIHGFNSWQAVYQVNLLPAEIVKQNKQHKILGAQANIWTEYMAYPTKVDYMIFPRMTALAEVLWSHPPQRDTTAFAKKLLQTAIPRYRFWNSSFFWEK